MAENTFQKASITVETAHRLIAAAEKKATEMGKPMCIAIVDGDGTLKAFSRMDGAPLLAVGIAQDKAYTAISFGGVATHEWYEFSDTLHPVERDELLGCSQVWPVPVGTTSATCG